MKHDLKNLNYIKSFKKAIFSFLTFENALKTTIKQAWIPQP